MKALICLLPGCGEELTRKQFENQDLYCCDLHSKLHLEMMDPKSERVQVAMAALKAAGCPAEVLLEAIGESLIDDEKHKKTKKSKKEMSGRRLRLHNHPFLERDLKVPEGHVIIDSDVYFALLNLHGGFVDVGDHRALLNEARV